MTSIAVYSHALAAAAFLLLGLSLLFSWRRHPHGAVLMAACLLTALWAASIAWTSRHELMWSSTTAVCELLRNAAWTAFLVRLLGHYRDDASRLPFRLRPWAAAVVVVYLALLGAAVGGHWNLVDLEQTRLMPSVAAHIVLSVFGMLLVEQVYRNGTLQERWALKFACLAICGAFAYDFYLYSHTMLFRAPSPDIWAARGVAITLTVPLLALSIARSKSWASPLALSRNLMFHSAALVGSAVYLLAMGSAGYYLRYFGGDWGAVMQATFLFGALVLLAGVLFSGAFRARLRVFISKHFYTYNYDYREEWMRFTRTLSEHGPGLGDRAIQAVAALVESPGGMLWLRRERGAEAHVFEPAAHWQVPVQHGLQEPGDGEFCHFLESTQWVIDLHEYTVTPDKYAGLRLPAWLRIFPRGWLVVPLMLHGKLFGFVVLQTARSPIQLNWEVIDLLEIAGSQAASYLAQQEAANALMVARQFESFNRMSTFVVHDLKNLVLQLSLMNANAEKHKDNPEFQRDMLDTVAYSVQKMKLLLQKLGRSDSAGAPARLAVDQVVRQAVALKAAFEPRPVLQVERAGLEVLAERERLERVVGHLIQNAIEATPRSGQVTIRVAADGPMVCIEIADTGEGMSEEFIRERLFKPFESTKSAGMGIGVFESREYINELGGSLEVHSRPSLGTTFKVCLPLYRHDARAVERAA